jgi:hypothetical protein
VRPTFGDPDLEALNPGVGSFADTGAVAARSARDGTLTENLTITNRKRRSRTAYVHVYVDRGAASLDAGYRLTVRRLKRK